MAHIVPEGHVVAVVVITLMPGWRLGLFVVTWDSL